MIVNQHFLYFYFLFINKVIRIKSHRSIDTQEKIDENG